MMWTYTQARPVVWQSVVCAGLVTVLFIGVGCSSSGSARDTRVIPTQYTFWPPFPNEPRIQHLVSYARSSDIAPAVRASALETLVFGAEARDDLPIIKPYGIAMWKGRIYVCDIKASSVVVLDLIARETRLMGVTGGNALQKPTDIAIADDGTMYVCDKVRRAIVVFDVEERFAAIFTQPGFEPVGLAVLGKELYICDAESRQIVVMDRFSGKELRRIGEPASEDDSYEDRGFGYPLGIAVDRDGNVYVSDVMASRVQKFAPDGTVSVVYSVLGDTLGHNRRPKHLDVDKYGQVYVVDASFANVQVFANDGQLLTYFGGAGGHRGAMYLPVGVCVVDLDPTTRQVFEPYIHEAFEVEQLILVTNQFGPRKVSVYGLGALKEGKTIDDIVPTRIETPTGIAPPTDEGDEAPAEIDPTPDDKRQP